MIYYIIWSISYDMDHFISYGPYDMVHVICDYENGTETFDIGWPLIIFQANTFIGSPASKIYKLCSFQKQKLNFNVIQDSSAVVRKLTGKSDKQLFATLNLVNIRRLGIVSGSLTIELFPSSRSPKFFSFSISGWISTISFHSKSRVHNLRNLDYL